MQVFTAQKKTLSMRVKNGVTFIELLVVVVIIGAIAIPLLITYRTYRTSQALATSSEAVANNIRSAHIFAREARSQREWGVKNLDPQMYALYSTGASGEVIEQRYSLASGVQFEKDFNILFTIGTGEADTNYEINLINTTGTETRISISEIGAVEVLRL